MSSSIVKRLRSQTSLGLDSESPKKQRKRDDKNNKKLNASKDSINELANNKTTSGVNRQVSKVSQKIIEEVGQLIGNEEEIAYKQSLASKSIFADGTCYKANRLINLYLQLPDEIDTEVVRGFEGEFVALAD